MPESNDSRESTIEAGRSFAASVSETAGNVGRTAQSQRAWHDVLAAAQVRGFFGTVSIEATLQDGTIQHIRRRVEQLEK